MKYKGKAIEILGTKEIFGQEVAWIRVLDDNSFLQVSMDDIHQQEEVFSIAHLRFIAIAAKIKDEIAKKKILAPYESSLIPLPHQILVLEKVMQSTQNRFLLADEVGMGKTIETGLILKELKLRGDIKRILVIVPKSSMLQWQSEMKEHFNEVFHIYDSEMITSMARTFSNFNADEEFNFWKQHHQIIVTTDALKPLEKRQGWTRERVDEYNKYRMEAVLNADFDLVIIDEAHKMGGASQTVSRYVLAQALCNSVANVLLLTATPHRGKADHFRRILQLLDPDAFDGEGLPQIKELEPYVIRTEKRLALDYDGKKLFNERLTHRFDVPLNNIEHQKQLALYTAVTDYVRQGFNRAKKTNNSAVGLIMILFQRLVSSSTAAILSSMQGRLERLRNEDDDEDIEAYSDDIDSHEEDPIHIDDFDGIYSDTIEDMEDEEDLLSALIIQAKNCINSETDAKATALLQKYKDLQQKENNPELKILVFTEFRSTQKMLHHFFLNQGYRSTYINGSQDLDERKIALAEFKKSAQVMVATDAAGESLNMQFCHIVFNYDLPWNPMMIEQRIGRVDRIGQNHKVQAYNMLTDNSVDLRVYRVIEEKLRMIIRQLGIDKTSDVLDSALDMKKINHLYLQSLLDPDRFEFSGEQWLYDIKLKLRNYKSTEGILPTVNENEIDSKKASEIKHSPLPIWLEDLVTQYVFIKNGKLKKSLLGYLDIEINKEQKKICFDSEISLSNPGIENMTMQHDWIKKILSDVHEVNASNSIAVLFSDLADETPGYWSLWSINAHNGLEEKTVYQSFFIADNGKQYSAYANDIWNRLVSSNSLFKIVNTQASEKFESTKLMLDEYLYISFQNLEVDIQEKMKLKKENRLKSYDFQKSRIEKIGIANIRDSKLKKLKDEYAIWVRDFQVDQKVIPDLKQLITIRIDG
jgi:SNF2 family DNA or RNA helicase